MRYFGFFCLNQNPLYAFGPYSEKNQLFSFEFCQKFKFWKYLRWLSIRRNQFFVGTYLNFCCEMFIFGVIDLFLLVFRNSILFSQNRISVGSFLVLYENNSMDWPSQLGNYFITHTESLRKVFQRWLNQAKRIFLYAQPTLRFWQFLHGHPNARSASAEQISSLSVSTRKRF
jgi:hypothetical protein